MDGRQRIAIGERGVFDLFESVGKGDFRQVSTRLKREGVDRLETTRKVDALEIRASFEGAKADRLQLVGEGYRLESAPLEGARADFDDFASGDLRRNLQLRHLRRRHPRDRRVLSVFDPVEGAPAVPLRGWRLWRAGSVRRGLRGVELRNGRRLFRRDGLRRRAVLSRPFFGVTSRRNDETRLLRERVRADRRHEVRERDRVESRTIGEGARADRRHGVGENNLVEIRRIFERSVRDPRYGAAVDGIGNDDARQSAFARGIVLLNVT